MIFTIDWLGYSIMNMITFLINALLIYLEQESIKKCTSALKNVPNLLGYPMSQPMTIELSF
jgi:hypothetical protein